MKKAERKKFLEFVGGASLSEEEWARELYGDVTETLEKVDGRWALVSKKTGKPLAYYDGEGKPSDEWVAKQERRVQFFKHMNK